MTELNELARESFAAGNRQASGASPDEVLALYVDAGFEVTPTLREFVAKYEGLRFKHPSSKTDGIGTAHLRALDLDDDLDPEAVGGYTDTVGSKMIPIGEAYNGHVMLMIDEKGRLYEAYDLHFALLGGDLEDGLNAIFEQRDVQTIEVIEGS